MNDDHSVLVVGKPGTDGIARRIASRGVSDLLLATGVLLVVALMVLRTPPTVVDALVAFNISVGVGLLLLALYVPTTVSFNSFPSVLLISTLFRLALSVATTRLILLDGDAGQIIDAFGQFVAGGNLIVGIVVFIIITAVQFIVIAKGAERVAEVAARFTLDAMPGKQMSIDSDLRAGLIDKEEARRRRAHHEQESQLNGALDGAMKFVKGDAIAGIIIVLVNLIGGLGIGIAQRGMSFAEAAQVFSILTIGDGMVAQIPALLSAMAAGLIVTRASGQTSDTHLGEVIAHQMFSRPRPLFVTGITALVLGLVPGFPTLVFLSIAIVLMVAALFASKRELNSELSLAGSSEATSPFNRPNISMHQDIVLAYAPDAPDAQERANRMQETVSNALRQIERELGIVLPNCSPYPDASISSGGYELRHVDTVIVPHDPSGQGGTGETGDSGEAQSIVQQLHRDAWRYFGIEETGQMLEGLAATQPTLSREVQRVATLPQLTDILRRLLAERVSIRNQREIFESLLHWTDKEKDPAGLAEFVRVSLGRSITSQHANDQRQLFAITLNPALERELRESLKPVAGSQVAMLAADRSTQIVQHIRTQIDQATKECEAATSGQSTAIIESTSGQVLPPKTVSPIVLTAIDVRRHVRKLLAPTMPDQAVLSFQELADPLQLIRVGEPPAEALTNGASQ